MSNGTRPSKSNGTGPSKSNDTYFVPVLLKMLL